MQNRNRPPKNKKFKVALPCPLAHKGLCATADAWCIYQVRDTTEAAFRLLSKYDEGSWWAFLREVWMTLRLRSSSCLPTTASEDHG